MQRVEISHPGLPRGALMVCIPEVDHQQNHISQIDPNNNLLPIALDCLKDRNIEQPSAQQVCERVAALRTTNVYTESVRAVQMTITQRDMQERLFSLREEHTREIQNLQDIQSREREAIIVAKEQEIQDLHQSHDRAIAAKEREIQQLRRELEQTTHRMNEKEEVLEQLERRTDQMQLEAKGEL